MQSKYLERKPISTSVKCNALTYDMTDVKFSLNLDGPNEASQGQNIFPVQMKPHIVEMVVYTSLAQIVFKGRIGR